VCTAPAEGALEPRLLETTERITRGAGSEERYIANILMENESAESLLVTEVVTPAGHWSSYPPHKHDRDDPPHETLLEETYYHRLRGGSGFAIQRVYTDDRTLDEAVAVSDGDVVLVPRGYHPVAGDPRVDLYYLNVMAGPIREWRVAVAPGY
jgi:5-deoxy-glucuronate isomerase